MQAKADERKIDLDEALLTHQYMADTQDAETWMNEKEPIVANIGYGKDEDTAQVQLIKSIERYYMDFSDLMAFSKSLHDKQSVNIEWNSPILQH